MSIDRRGFFRKLVTAAVAPFVAMPIQKYQWNKSHALAFSTLSTSKLYFTKQNLMNKLYDVQTLECLPRLDYSGDPLYDIVPREKDLVELGAEQTHRANRYYTYVCDTSEIV
jgi:hypothetical protein